MPFPNKRNQGSLERWLTLELEQRKYKMSLEHLIVPENKEMLKTTKGSEYVEGAQEIT